MRIQDHLIPPNMLYLGSYVGRWFCRTIPSRQLHFQS